MTQGSTFTVDPSSSYESVDVLRCHSAAPWLSYYSMRYHPYLAHRAAKRPRVTRVELRLLDRDLADAGVHIPWTAFVRTDDRTRLLVKRTMLDILDAA